MRVFLTGATGFIGSRIAGELLSAGHEVLGLTRSASGAAAAFDHDFSRYAANCEKDRRAIAAIGEALARGDRPLIITSVTGIGSSAPGEPAVEDHLDLAHPIPRVASEQAGEALKAEGVNVITVRLPQVHDTVRQGLISPFIDVARERGVSAYVGEGANRFSAAHVSDVARLYRLALEKGQRNARYHAVAEEGVTLRAIAEVLGAGLGLPVVSIPADRAGDHFGYMATFAGLDLIASSASTRDRLGWTPEGPDLLSDLRAMDYAPPAAE